MADKTTPMTDETTGSTTTGSTATGTTGATSSTTSGDAPATTGARRMPQFKTDTASVRTLVARVLWGLCLLFAVILAAAVLLVALEANPSNDLVGWIGDRSNDVDLGFFDLSNPIKDFDNTKQTVLFNYGIAAIVWLVVGRILDRVVRP